MSSRFRGERSAALAACERCCSGIHFLRVDRLRLSKNNAPAVRDVPADQLAQPPAWAYELSDSAAFTLERICIDGAAEMDGPALQEATFSAYDALMSRLAEQGPWHPVRIWNFVPRILAAGGEGQDRYMRFNAGRHRAFCKRLGTGQFERMLPAASAVGYGGGSLIVHTMACRRPATCIANPRQQEPHRYSRRFGPLPPCFARAVLLENAGEKLLLVGGTASVRGEDSVHIGDVRAQLAETFENLSAVASQAWGGDAPLAGYREVRVYYVRESDVAEVRHAVLSRLPQLTRVEFTQAELCRADLLVEIEGIAYAKSP